MELSKILVRAVFAYLFALILLRLSGKRELAEATAFDFVLAIIVGDMFDDLFWAEVSAAQFVVAVGTLVMMEVVISAMSYLSPWFAWLVDGPRVMVLRDGSMVRRAMRRERLNEKDLKKLLRRKGRLEKERWAEVRSALVELDGEPSVLKHEWARAAQKQDTERVREAVK